ncbi:hypothetical protein SAMN02910265_00851 [Ruminococcus flavefaciens]|uniref:Uncharacterized protein n=2 Tax=Ruminococcus flavefaciens TaxID=1265 RepID=A0A1H6IK38_RUMFL|nr:hypothetical protein SAMN02910265_00851 [Ruminococcus flavefaciens]
MTTQKRNRIFEMILGVILIVLSLISFKSFIRSYFPYSRHISWDDIKDFFSMGKNAVLATINLIAVLFQAVFGLMLITGKYTKSWLQIPLAITAAARIISTYIVWLIIELITGDIKYSDFSRYFATKQFICLIIAPLIEAIGIIVAFMTINKKIVWKSRKSLLIYSLAGTAASIILSAVTNLAAVSALIFLIPCFVQPYASKRSIKGIIAEIAAILCSLSYYIVRWLINKIYDSENEALYNFFFGTNPAIDLRHFDVRSFLEWALRLTSLLIPLILFERQVGELKEEEASEHISVIKKLDAVLFKNNDEEADDDEYSEEDDEYSDEEESDDDND